MRVHHIVWIGLGVAGCAMAAEAFSHRGQINQPPDPPIRTSQQRHVGLALIVPGVSGAEASALGAELTRRGLSLLVIDPVTLEPTAHTAALLVGFKLGSQLSIQDSARVVLVGFDKGATMIPFLVNRFPQELRKRIAALVLVRPLMRVNFRSGQAPGWSNRPRPTDFPIQPELERVRDIPVQCLDSSQLNATCHTLRPGSTPSAAEPTRMRDLGNLISAEFSLRTQ